MDTNKKIFVLKPKNQSNYESLIVWAEDEVKAQSASDNRMNLPKPTSPNTPLEQIEEFYINKNLTDCTEVECEIIESSKEVIHIKYLGNEYYLTPSEPKPLLPPSDKNSTS